MKRGALNSVRDDFFGFSLGKNLNNFEFSGNRTRDIGKYLETAEIVLVPVQLWGPSLVLAGGTPLLLLHPGCHQAVVVIAVPVRRGM